MPRELIMISVFDLLYRCWKQLLDIKDAIVHTSSNRRLLVTGAYIPSTKFQGILSRHPTGS